MDLSVWPTHCMPHAASYAINYVVSFTVDVSLTSVVFVGNY
jgi:hypothetical protein